jgi:hypothetical protein
MRHVFLLALLLAASPAVAQDSPLAFDIAKLCAWQHENNSMDVEECTALESEAQKAIPALEGKADAKRKEDCTAEAQNYSGDSGFASYTVFATCLKDGPGSQ